MKARQWINKNSPVLIGVSLVVIVLCLFFLYKTMNPSLPPVITKIYYYDLTTNKLFIADEEALPPIPAPSGKKTPDGQDAGVHAFVFACGDCDDDTKRFVGYLETFTPGARSVALASRNNTQPLPTTVPAPDLIANGRLVMNPDDIKSGWVPSSSPNGMTVIQKAAVKCGSAQYPVPCYPPQ